MRLGDHLCVDDYDAIWGEPKRAVRPSIGDRLMLWGIVIVVGIGLSFVQ